MFHMLGIYKPYSVKVEEIKKTFSLPVFVHPFEPYIPGVCFDDEQWSAHKRMISRIAKERKQQKPPQTRILHETRYREPPVSHTIIGKIVGIDEKTFEITKYATIDAATKHLIPANRNKIVRCIADRGDTACGCYWIHE